MKGKINGLDKIQKAENYLEQILNSEHKQAYLERILNYEKFSKADARVDKIVSVFAVLSAPNCAFQTLTNTSSTAFLVSSLVTVALSVYLAYSYKTRHVKHIINHYEKENKLSFDIKKEDNIENLDEKDLHMYLDNEKGTQENLSPLNKKEFSEVVKYIKTNYAEDIEKVQKNQPKCKFVLKKAIEKIDGLKNSLIDLKKSILQNQFVANNTKENHKTNSHQQKADLGMEM